MALPPDYEVRVYAGVLGKLIGVYLGRPVEGWSYERIARELGEVSYYVQLRQGKPVVMTDDDIGGTFTFVRAMADYGCRRDLTPSQIGQTWLNYLVERRSVLWWGGLGSSTEHTAYLRLKAGIPAPASGASATNSQLVAEQIGAQIFIDGWAMLAPGDPEFAADLARRAASVSHDGEAIYGAQVLAAMEALAFVEPDIDRLLDAGLRQIPSGCVIHRLIDDLRTWHGQEADWRRARASLEAHYGPSMYPGDCHIVPNHGLVILALLYGEGNLHRSLTIVNTSSWDTDCNSGNLGCLLGIRNGLNGIEAGPDWRGPVADRLYLSTADGGRCITDAVTEAYHIANMGRALAGQGVRQPKGGARFHFELPGAMQGFQAEDSAECRGNANLSNVAGHSRRGARSLAIRYRHVARNRPARVATPTFIPPEAIPLTAPTVGYRLMASPTLYPGQTVRAGVWADEANGQLVSCRLYLRSYGADDQLVITNGPLVELAAGQSHEFAWTVGDMGGQPIAEIGVEVASELRADGVVYLDYLTWDGVPNTELSRPATGSMWRRAWVDAVSNLVAWLPDGYRLTQDEGTGLLIQGCREWTDYRVSATIDLKMVRAGGIAARVQGLRRYYALLLCHDGKARLVKALDGCTTLAEAEYGWAWGTSHEFSLRVVGNRVQGAIDGRVYLDITDGDRPLTGGAVALLCEEGCLATPAVRVEPATI